MKEIDELFDRISKDCDIVRLRLDIAKLIAKMLVEKQETLGYWEKLKFSQSIVSLEENICGNKQKPATYLTHCVCCLKDVHLAKEKRNEDYVPRDKNIEDLTYEKLMDSIRKISERELFPPTY